MGETARVIPTAIDLDLQSVRRHFPALSLRIDGRPVVYLDNPAGTQVPQRVIDRTAAYWQTMNANHGGVFATSERSDALILEARAAAAAFVNAGSPEEIIFGPNMTTLTFAVSRAIARELRPGDEIVVTRLEHDGNVSPWLALQEQGVVVRFADIRTPECTLDLDDLGRQLSPQAIPRSKILCSKISLNRKPLCLNSKPKRAWKTSGATSATALGATCAKDARKSSILMEITRRV